MKMGKIARQKTVTRQEQFRLQPEKMLESYAHQNRLVDPTHFTDDGVSGTRVDRPGFLAMMEEVDIGREEAIVIKHIR